MRLLLWRVFVVGPAVVVANVAAALPSIAVMYLIGGNDTAQWQGWLLAVGVVLFVLTAVLLGTHPVTRQWMEWVEKTDKRLR